MDSVLQAAIGVGLEQFVEWAGSLDLQTIEDEELRALIEYARVAALAQRARNDVDRAASADSPLN